MSSVKPLLAIGFIGLGAATAATVVYMQSNPRAFTSDFPPVPAAAPAAATVLPSEPHVVVDMPTIEIFATPSRPLTVPTVSTRTVLEPCSPWEELASGPATRRVRVLCEKPAPVPGS